MGLGELDGDRVDAAAEPAPEFILQSSAGRIIPLSEELALARSYLEVEQVGPEGDGAWFGRNVVTGAKPAAGSTVKVKVTGITYEEMRRGCWDPKARVEDMLLVEPGEDFDSLIVEIRAGTGGDEAALFAGDLFKMLSRYAEERGFSTLATIDRIVEVAADAITASVTRPSVNQCSEASSMRAAQHWNGTARSVMSTRPSRSSARPTCSSPPCPSCC